MHGFSPFRSKPARYIAVAAVVAAGISMTGVLHATASAADSTVITLSDINAFTGASAPYGIRSDNGAQVAVKEINAAGGFTDKAGHKYTLKIEKQDMGNSREEVIALLRQAASKKDVLAVIGPTNSVGFVPAVPVVAQMKIVMIGEAGAPVKTWNPWAYRTSIASSSDVPILMKVVTEKLKLKKVAVLYDQTQDAQAGEAELVKELAEKLGYEVVASEAFRSGAQDFSAQISTIKAKNPDAIYLAATTGDGPTVALQVRQAGVKVPMMTGFGSFADPVYWNNSKGSIKGCYTYINGADFAKPTAELKKFLDDYNKDFPNEPPTVFSLYGYDAVYAVVNAVKISGSATDREKFQQAMQNLEFTSPVGDRVSFKNPPSGNNLGGLVRVVEVEGEGKYKELAAVKQ